MSAIVRQTGALFFDAYRELNAKKLFWVVLGLSVLFVGAFALVGVNDKGLTLLWWTIPIPVFNATTLPSKAFFYKFVFINFGFQLWLTWAACLAIVDSVLERVPGTTRSRRRKRNRGASEPTPVPRSPRLPSLTPTG